MIVAWLGARIVGLPRWAWLLALVAAALLGWLWIASAEDADDRRNQEIGRQEERSEQRADTIRNVEKANEAERKITADPDAARANCLRHSRTPENC